jgi:guanylate kinase
MCRIAGGGATVGKKLVILSGPSCVGKGSLRQALRRHHPDLSDTEVVLCNSRRPRLRRDTNTYEVHGIDYFFLPRSLFDQLDGDRFVVVGVRSDVQAMDMARVRELLEENDLVLTEAHHTFHGPVMQWARRHAELGFEIQIVLLVPLSDDEISHRVNETGKTPEQIVYEVMRAKLERRGIDPPRKVEERARSALHEIQKVAPYAHRIVNHAGEDDLEEWSDPLGSEAQRVLAEFVDVLLS